MPRKPADPARFAMLGLADPDPRGELATDAMTIDVLVHGLLPRGASDPVEGLVNGVRAELEVLSALCEPPLGEVLEMLGRRLYVANVLLRRTDEREPIPEVLAPTGDVPLGAQYVPPETFATTPAPAEPEGHATTPAPAPFAIDDEPTATHERGE